MVPPLKIIEMVRVEMDEKRNGNHKGIDSVQMASRAKHMRHSRVGKNVTKLLEQSGIARAINHNHFFAVQHRVF